MPPQLTSLQKGDNTSLTKAAEDAGVKLENLSFGLHWKPRATDGPKYDLDAVAVVPGRELVFFNQQDPYGGALKLSGDNRTGEGDGDDETIWGVISQLEALGIEKFILAVVIYEAEQRKQNFGNVDDCGVRVYTTTGKHEVSTTVPDDQILAKYDLQEDFNRETAVKVAEVYKKDGDWKVRALGEGYSAGLAGLVAEYGAIIPPPR